MRHKVIGILALLVCSFLFAVPANAVSIPACVGVNQDGTTEFTLVGRDNAVFEPGPTVINGNVLVTGANGSIKFGANNTVNGTATAATIFLGVKVVVNHCVANNIVVAAAAPADRGKCITTSLPPAPGGFGEVPDACLDFAFGPPSPGIPAVVNACVNTAANLTVPAGATVSLPNGTTTPPNTTCFGNLQIGKDATLKLNGLNGPFNFKSVHMVIGSSLLGEPNPPATVNVGGAPSQGQFLANELSVITDINLNSASSSGEVVKIKNSTILTRVIINAPFGKVHLHTGTALRECSEVIGTILDIQPITTECVPPEPVVCVCPTNFVFQIDNNPPIDAVTQARACVRQ
jgi:hypothetical protein